MAGVGVAGWDGGTDLFLDVARRLSGDPQLRFRWVGRRSSGAARWLDADAALIGLSEQISWSDSDRAEPDAAVAIVPARTVDARDAANAQLDGSVPVVAFELRGADRARATDLVEFPDTAALAARVRSLLDEGRR